MKDEQYTRSDLTQIKKFIEDPRNHVDSCRDVHARVLDRLPPFALPSMDYIREFNGNIGE